jgi:hypothetical protein
MKEKIRKYIRKIINESFEFSGTIYYPTEEKINPETGEKISEERYIIKGTYVGGQAWIDKIKDTITGEVYNDAEEVFRSDEIEEIKWMIENASEGWEIDATERQQDDLYPDHQEITEKAVSKSQQRFMGMVKNCQDNPEDCDKYSKSVKDAAKSMTKKDAEDFASTKHKELPNHVNEESPLAFSDGDIFKRLQDNAPMGNKMVKNALTYLRRLKYQQFKDIIIAALDEIGKPIENWDMDDWQILSDLTHDYEF